MNLLENMNDALSYIEDNLTNEIDYKEVHSSFNEVT